MFDCTRSKPNQVSVPAGLTLAIGFSFCFKCQPGSSLVLRRPIEITAFIRHVDYFRDGNELADCRGVFRLRCSM